MGVTLTCLSGRRVLIVAVHHGLAIRPVPAVAYAVERQGLVEYGGEVGRVGGVQDVFVEGVAPQL